MNLVEIIVRTKDETASQLKGIEKAAKDSGTASGKGFSSEFDKEVGKGTLGGVLGKSGTAKSDAEKAGQDVATGFASGMKSKFSSALGSGLLGGLFGTSGGSRLFGNAGSSVEADARKEGDAVGRGFATGLAGALRSFKMPNLLGSLRKSTIGPSGSGFLGSIGNLIPGLAGTSEGASGAGALAPAGGSMLANPYTIMAAAAVAPFAGQIGGAGLVGGLGAGLAGMGILGSLDLTKNKQGNDVIGVASIRNAFDQLKTDANKDLTEIGTPFRPVMTSLLTTATSVMNKLTPVFTGAEKMIAGPLKLLGDTLLNSFNQPQVKQSILAVANAFSSLLKALAPQIPNDMRMIANAITAIANNVAANPQAFAGFINFLVKLVVYALNVVNALTATANVIENDFLPAMMMVGKAGITAAQEFLNAMKVMEDVALSAFGTILHGAADAFGWVPGLGGKLRGASQEFDSWKASVDATFSSANATLNGWKQNLSTMQTKISLKGDITDLQNKLSTARNELDDPNLTKARRAEIQANISQLQSQVARAKALLDELNGKVVTADINAMYTTSGSKTAQSLLNPGFAAGGVIGAAVGGARSGYVMVGEHGPELVKLPGGSTVRSNSDTQSMMSGGGVAVSLEIAGGQSDFEKFMSTFIKNYVRIKGGGNVQSAFGRS